MIRENDMTNITLGTPGTSVPQRGPETGLFVERPIGMNLIAMSRTGALQTLFLPYPPKGRYGFDARIPVVLEAIDEGWRARATGRAGFYGPSGETTKEMVLTNRGMCPLADDSEEYMLYAEEVNEESYAFHNYVTLSNVRISIGRLEDNDIVYPGSTVSRHHAMLEYRDRVWRITDTGSANGVYVNGYRVSEQRLHVGDVIHIMGLRMIIGSGFLSINDGNNRVGISQAKLRLVEKTGSVLDVALPGKDAKKTELFNRFPRRRLAMDIGRIEIESPPMTMNGEKLPLMMRMGSSMVMSGTAAMTGNVAMLVSSLLLPVLSQRYTKEEKEEYERLREEKYREYLDLKEEEILEEKAREEQVLDENYPVLEEVLTYASSKKEKLWERRKTDDDFLSLRLGNGSIPMKAEVVCQQKRFELETDELSEEMYALAEEERYLEDVPVMLSLIENPVCGVLGERAGTLKYIKSLIMRLSLLYSYDEVKMVFLIEKDDLAGFEFVKYLPHVWDDQHNIRFIATEVKETFQIGDFISNSLEKDLEKPAKLQDMMVRHPYYIVFAFSKRLYDSMEVLKTAMQHDETCGLSVFAVFDNVPKECTVLLNIEDGEGEQAAAGTLVYIKQLDKEDDLFTPDRYDPQSAETAMRIIANTDLKLISEAYSLPKSLTFLQVFSAGRIEHLNILKRWKENNPVSSLAVPIGVGTDGELFTLDLHQHYQGPHGLVAGTTGSGKSEFLLTYILSLALNFHPDEVAFVLIDYKGGGLAGAFDDPANGIHLPHLIATITNLDGAAISRSLVSIQSEMMRRQRKFNEAKSATGEGTMDIYTYQRLRRNGKVKEAMPHLFIISDEFAELKQQQPDFLDQLVSIARIGRSLGVHLILATQKPGGVVTDQILSNTKFRVCLKVADRTDSMEMLKRPEASEIRETGRFYLQVGNNELFALGQSAWSGAQYEPQDEVLSSKDESIRVIDHLGNTVLETKPEQKKQKTGRSQLVEIVREITHIARENGIPERSLWLPALSDRMDVLELEKTCVPTEDMVPEGAMHVCMGMLDDPENQAQYPLFINMEQTGHILLAGDQGSGKTTFIQTLLYSMVRRYGPEELQYYILDYSSRLLRVFQKMPHCGAVLVEEDESYLDSFFKLINEIVAERKTLFSQLEVDNFSDAKKVQPLPLILVIIDNLPGMLQSNKGFSQYEHFPEYLKNSSNLGIAYIVSISHVSEMKMRSRQEMRTKLGIQLKDRYEYADLLGINLPHMPAEKSGRGLYLYKGETLEMQLAMFAPEKPPKERIQDLKEELDELAKQYAGGVTAKKLNIVSPTQTYEEFSENFRPGRLPLGYARRDSLPVAIPYKQLKGLSVYFGNDGSIRPVLENLLTAAKRENMVVVFQKSRRKSLANVLPLPEDARIFEANKEDVPQLATFLLANCSHRYGLYKQFCEGAELEPETAASTAEGFGYIRDNFRPIMVIFERYSDLVAVSNETEGLLSQFSSAYMLAGFCNIYPIGVFYRDDPANVWGSDLFKCFNPEKLYALIGGNYKDQSLVSLPYTFDFTDKPDAFNSGWIHYRGMLHPIFIPCGEQEAEEMDEDDKPVFGG